MEFLWCSLYSCFSSSIRFLLSFFGFILYLFSIRKSASKILWTLVELSLSCKLGTGLPGIKFTWQSFWPSLSDQYYICYHRFAVETYGYCLFQQTNWLLCSVDCRLTMHILLALLPVIPGASRAYLCSGSCVDINSQPIYSGITQLHFMYPWIIYSFPPLYADDAAYRDDFESS